MAARMNLLENGPFSLCREKGNGFSCFFRAVFIGVVWMVVLLSAADAATQSRKPEVSITGPDSAEVGQQVGLTAKVVNAPAGTITFEWQQLSGTRIRLPFDDSWKKSEIVFVPRDAGEYLFKITATMQGLALSSQKRLIVKLITARPSKPAVSSSAPPVQVSVIPSPNPPVSAQNLVLMARAQGGPESTYGFTWLQTAGEPVTPSNGWTSPTLFFPRGLLKTGITYAFKVTAKSGSAQGNAVITVNLK